MYAFLKSVHLISLHLMIGGAAFGYLIWCRPPHAHDGVWPRLRRGVVVGGVLFVVSGLADAVRAAAQVIPVDALDLLWLFLTHTLHGQMSLLKAMLAPLFVVVGLVVPWRRRHLAGGGLAVLAIGLMLAISSTSHAAAAGIVPLLSDLVHQGATVVWGGGVIYLALFPWGRWSEENTAPLSEVAAAVKRFSTMALGAVAVVIVTGVVSTVALVDTPASLPSTGYGRTLVAKVGLFVSVLVVAAVNLLSLVPRLRANSNDRRQTLRRLGTVVRIEALLIVAVLVAAGVLTTLSPGM